MEYRTRPGPVSGGDQAEMSLTLKYLLENPSLLQPPESSKKDEKCKEDKHTDQNQNDLTSAYLGPQIWSDMLLSDDLKLEPVDLGDLLDGAGVDDELSDLGLLMAHSSSSHSMSSSYSSQGQQHNLSSSDLSTLAYQDMPSLVTINEPTTKQVPSPSEYFVPQVSNSALFPQAAQCNLIQGMPQLQPHNLSHGPGVDVGVSMQQQTILNQQLCDQQFALFSEVMSNNQLQNDQQLTSTTNSAPTQQHITNPPLAHQLSQSLNFQSNMPSMSRSQSDDVFCSQQLLERASLPSQQANAVQSSSNEAKISAFENKEIPLNHEALSSPVAIDIRIPSPKKVNFTPSTADVILATPRTDDGDETTFDPTTRRFTEEELKPQPIVRKSRKVYVPSDNKDGKYWNRRNKNNVAAKRSREARRIKENQIALRANYLEQENSSLKTEVSELRQELTRVMELVRKYEKCFSEKNCN